MISSKSKCFKLKNRMKIIKKIKTILDLKLKEIKLVRSLMDQRKERIVNINQWLSEDTNQAQSMRTNSLSI